jgi:hypothetical protein
MTDDADCTQRWQLIQDLAATDPYAPYMVCKHCRHQLTQRHRGDCLWVRANRLVDQTADRP